MVGSVVSLVVLPSGCGGGSGASKPTPLPVIDPLPPLALAPGDPYFTVDGVQRLVMTRNVTGPTVADIVGLLDRTKAAGGTAVRLHLMHGLGSGVSAGAVDESWASAWDGVFDHARQIGLYVIPVFGVWADWNDGTPDLGFASWTTNPWNAANGGPAQKPGELLKSGSAARTAWLAWLDALVARWQSRPNVAAWETFSELDLMTEANEEDGASFAADAAAVVRSRDGAARPVMVSLSALNDWPSLLGGGAVDIVQVHPYAENLDVALLAAVGAKLTAYGKPVLIGESGLAAAAPTGNTATTAPNAPVAVKHAIWAGVVSGAMNARGLWWEDGYALYEPPGAAFVDSYADAEAPAARFVRTVEFGGLRPLAVAPATDLVGAAIGNEMGVVGWVRRAACGAPDWDCATEVENATVTVTVPGTTASWLPVFYDPTSGSALSGGGAVSRTGSDVVVPLPKLSDDLAFTLTPSLN